MPCSCVIVGCKSRGEKGGKGFFRLPKIITNQGVEARMKSERRRQLWLAAINRSNLPCPDTFRICSDHFVKGKPHPWDENDPDWVPNKDLIFTPRRNSSLKADQHLKQLQNRKTMKKTVADVQQLIGHTEEPTPPFSGTKEETEYPLPVHIKKEEEESDVTKLYSISIQREELPHQTKVESSSLEQENQRADHFKEEEEKPQTPDIKEEEEHPQPPDVTEKEENPLPPDIKEEEEGPKPSDIKEEEEELPLNIIVMKSEDDEPLDRSQFHEQSPSGDHCGAMPPDNLLSPLSDSDDIEEPSRSDADCEDEDKEWERSEKKNRCRKKTSQMHKKRVTCSVCAKNVAKEKIIRHMRTHTGEKPFSCTVCNKKFSSRDYVSTHMRTHTGEKPFGCAFCNKTFSHKSHVITHVRIHTGEKPYSCSVCGKTFSSKDYVNSHMRTHTGEKPFSCSLCDRTFSQKPHLVTHMRTHTGEKPFSCTVCGKSYAHKNSLTTHMWGHC